MAQYTDEQYYSEFEGRPTWNGFQSYMQGTVVEYLGNYYKALNMLPAQVETTEIVSSRKLVFNPSTDVDPTWSGAVSPFQFSYNFGLRLAMAFPDPQLPSSPFPQVYTLTFTEDLVSPNFTLPAGEYLATHNGGTTDRVGYQNITFSFAGYNDGEANDPGSFVTSVITNTDVDLVFSGNDNLPLVEETVTNPAVPNDNPVSDTTNWEVFEVPDVFGDNRFITLEDIINNYMVLYNDEENHGRSPRMKVEAFAQRAIQEYSYDMFRVKDWEYQVIDRATFPMPQDFVELVGINWVDQRGTERWLQRRKDSSNPRSYLQFDSTPVWDEFEAYDVGDYVKVDSGEVSIGGQTMYNIYRATLDNLGVEPNPDEQNNPWKEVQEGVNGYVYDSNGNIVEYENSSYTITQWNEDRSRREVVDNGRTTFGAFSNNYGKRYYLDTETRSSNPTFYINERDGVIDLDPSLIGEVITLTYVSDGLSNDPSEIKVHKFAEQAIYDYVYYEMIARSSRIPANEKERARRSKMASRKHAKLRLMNFSPRDLIQTLRKQAQWIRT